MKRTVNTLVIGSGAAGLAAALRLKSLGVDDMLLLSEGLNRGTSINTGSDKRIRIQMDAENYRARREQSLESLARKVAAKVQKYRRSVTLEPMNAYERHVIHAALQDVKGVTTYSVGAEPNRRVVVAFDRGEAR